MNSILKLILTFNIDTSPNAYGNLYPPSNSIGIGQPSPMYSSRTPSPQGYQFPHNVSSNTYYGQNSLSSNVHSPIIGKQI